MLSSEKLVLILVNVPHIQALERMMLAENDPNPV